MRILGIDPGVATVGFGAIESSGSNLKMVRCGVITTPAKQRLALRLSRIYTDMSEIIDMFKPDCIAIEELFFNTNLTTGIAVAHGRGVIILAGENKDIPMYEYTPLQIKQALTGYGRAEKRQVMDMVKRQLNLSQKAKPDDASDALAVAICHASYSSSLLNIEGNGTECFTI